MRHANASLSLSIIGLTLALATWSTPAHAYIDPVTGSFLVQGLIAGVMAVMAGVRSIRQRIVGLFRRRRENDQV